MIVLTLKASHSAFPCALCSLPFYSSAQIEAALGPVYGVDRQLIRDGTYFVVEHSRPCRRLRRLEPSPGRLWRGPGRDPRRDAALDPVHEPARIRAFFRASRLGTTPASVAPSFALASRRAVTLASARRCSSPTLAGEPLYASFGYSVAERYEIPLAGGLTISRRADGQEIPSNVTPSLASHCSGRRGSAWRDGLPLFRRRTWLRCLGRMSRASSIGAQGHRPFRRAARKRRRPCGDCHSWPCCTSVGRCGLSST